jgi:hypothetical protein
VAPSPHPPIKLPATLFVWPVVVVVVVVVGILLVGYYLRIHEWMGIQSHGI